MALASSPRYGAQIDWVAVHSAEGARTVESLFGFFERGQHASSHAGADGYRLSESWVPDERAAWTLLNGNPRSLNVELCGFARWTRAQWLSEGWVDGVWNPRQMIRNAARWTREKCDRHKIPKRLLTPEQVANNERGIIDHLRYTKGKKDGDHTDVGVNYPFDVFMNDVLGGDDVGTIDGMSEAGKRALFYETPIWTINGKPITLGVMLEQLHTALHAPFLSAGGSYQMSPRDAWRYIDFVQVKVDGLIKVVDSMATVLAGVAENDDRIEFDPAQFQQLRADVGQQMTTIRQELTEQVDQQLDELADRLAEQTGAERETVLNALNEFYGRAVIGPNAISNQRA